MHMSLVSSLIPLQGQELHKPEELSIVLASSSTVLPTQRVFLLLVTFEDK